MIFNITIIFYKNKIFGSSSSSSRYLGTLFNRFFKITYHAYCNVSINIGVISVQVPTDTDVMNGYFTKKILPVYASESNFIKTHRYKLKSNQFEKCFESLQ